MIKVSDVGDSTTLSKKQQLSCKDLNFKTDMSPFDLMINLDFIETLCTCDSCKQTFSKFLSSAEACENLCEEELQLQNNLNGQINDEEETADQNPRTEIDTARDVVKAMTGSSIPHAAQIHFAESVAKLKDYLRDFMLKASNDAQRVITEEDAECFKKGLENLKKKQM